MSGTPDQPTPDLWAPLHDAVVSGDRRAVLDLCAGLDDAERPRLGAALTGHYGDLTGPTHSTPDGRGRHAAYQLAVLGCAAQPRDASWALVSLARVSLEEQLEALAPRSAAWKRRFASAALSRDAARVGGGGRGWRIAHAWVRAGVIGTPTSRQWVLGVLGQYPWDALSAVRREDPAVADILDRFLDTPGVGRRLGERARHGGGGAWHELLHACGAFDPARRGEVVDTCLSALAAAATPTEATGFATLVQHLRLTEDELARRQGRCAGLLLAPTGPAITVGASAVGRVLDAGTLDATTVLDVTPEVLQGPTKARIREHLSLLDDLVDRGVAAPVDAGHAVVAALDTDRSDVVLLLADALARWAGALDGTDLDDLRVAVGSALPRPWPELSRALGVLAPADVPVATSPGAVLPVAAPVDLGAPAAVEPVADLDELLVLLEEVLPLGGSVLAFERALDGLTRFPLADAPPSHRARARRASGRWASSNPGDDVNALLLAWKGGPVLPLPAGRTEYGYTPDGGELPSGVSVLADHGGPAYQAWSRVVAAHDPGHLTTRRLGLLRTHHLTSSPGGLLSLPTAEDGTIDGEDLLRRLRDRQADGAEPEVHDLAWALLRLRPADRGGVLASGALSPADAERLRLVARAPDWRRDIAWRDAGAAPGAMDDPVRAWLNPESHARVELHTEWVLSGTSELPATLLWASALPTQPDHLAAHLQTPALAALHDEHQAVELLARSIGASRQPWGPPSAWAVVMGLSAEHKASRLAAAEALAAGSGTGVLTALTLTGALLDVLGPDAGPFDEPSVGSTGNGLPKVSRVATGLGDAARIHDAGGDLVLRALLPVLPDLLARPGAHALVAVAAQVTERLGPRAALPAAVLDLAGSRARTRVAEEARRLVAASTRTS